RRWRNLKNGCLMLRRWARESSTGCLPQRFPILNEKICCERRIDSKRDEKHFDGAPEISKSLKRNDGRRAGLRERLHSGIPRQTRPGSPFIGDVPRTKGFGALTHEGYRPRSGWALSGL